MRTRWFTLGLFAGVGGAAWVATRFRRIRQRMAPTAVARRGADAVADSLSSAADRLRGPADT